MSLANYTLPFVAPVASETYLGPQTYGQAVAINSLLYDTPRYGQRRQQTVPTSPSRRQPLNPRRVKDVRDPYRNQHQQRSRYNFAAATPGGRDNSKEYDEYSNESEFAYNKGRRTAQEGSNRAKKKSSALPKQQGNQVAGQQQQQQNEPPQRPPAYRRITNTFNSVPEPGAKTSLHAVLDFDDDFDEYSYEDEDMEPVSPSRQRAPKPDVTPIEGPILIKNGSVPVVPLFAYPVVNNGTLIQIPILWTALSLALGLEIHGEIVRGVPCIKRYHQLFCPTAGNTYPIEKIERFIDDNKALMKRMYGEFQMSTEYGPPERERHEGKKNVKRQARREDVEAFEEDLPKSDSYFRRHRPSRQTNKSGQNNSGRVDACESKIEIVTPYWASNSAGKIRAIVNTQHFEQAIHQEVCSKLQTKRCVGDCGCEQKYKWHRLLAYDPENDCKGIFMDWFLFPSCCVCRCAPVFGN